MCSGDWDAVSESLHGRDKRSGLYPDLDQREWRKCSTSHKFERNFWQSASHSGYLKERCMHGCD